MQPAEVLRKREGALTLLRTAAGSPASWPGKAARFGAAIAAYGQGRVIHERLEKLLRVGVLSEKPNDLQLLIGSIDMLRFWISPAAADYYESQGISYGFHQLLRFLDEPASLCDPIGLLSTRDGIIGHLMQVVHANPLYDVQLLELFDDGLDELEAQLVLMQEGRHPRSGSIGAIVEEAGYHAALLSWLRAYRRDRRSPPPLRQNVAASQEFRCLEAVFGGMDTAFRYFARLPSTPFAALQHLVTVRRFPWALVSDFAPAPASR